MEKINKPKLAFFQYKCHETLPKFVELHRYQHIKCLAHFFDVTVVNNDCDFQQICDLYHPDLALFESGVNYKGCQRIEIKNTHTNPSVPKLGLHNGDSWCEARAGFISDMELWGVEDYFSICTTMAEHTPNISKNLFVWPNFIDPEVYKDYYLEKTIPLLFTGYVNHPIYLWRKEIQEITSKHYEFKLLEHLGYNDNKSAVKMIYGEQYARAINTSCFVPTCGTVEKEIVRKHFEIPGSKSCLITERTKSVEAAGFIDMHNCVLVDQNNVLEKIDYLFNNLDDLERITISGYELVHSRHTLKQRDQILQWLQLKNKLKSNQEIKQINPFESLSIVKKIPEVKFSEYLSNGLILNLLRQGDEKLWEGKYEAAELLYLECLKYKQLMPEPKLKLGLCSLYKGKPEDAISWILQPIKYTLEEYKASTPDPVEWSYIIIALLCQGKLVEASIYIEQFPQLNHTELERTRWVIECLQNREPSFLNADSQSLKSRHSVHKVTFNNFSDWINHIGDLFICCKQLDFASYLQNSTNLYSVDLEKMSGKAKLKPNMSLPKFRLGYLRILNRLLIKINLNRLALDIFLSKKIIEIEYILLFGRVIKMKMKKFYMHIFNKIVK
jgi:tetratricopeptide (TPR) repeat protein